MDFLVHNGARDIETRVRRATNPVHGGLKQYVMNGTRRIVRGRPLRVTEEQLRKYIDELRRKEAQGILYVTTTDGKPYDLKTLEVLPSPPVVNPRPEMPLDSAARDTAGGEVLTRFNDPPPPHEFTMPVPPPDAAIEAPIVEPVAMPVLETSPADLPPVEPFLGESTEEPVPAPVQATESFRHSGRRRDRK